MRIFSDPFLCCKSISSTTLRGSPASCTEVSPTSKQFCSAWRSAWIISFSEGAGIFEPTNPMALSTRIPLGSPPVSMTLPPSTFDRAVTPPSLRALEFAHAACPSMRRSRMGVSGKCASSMVLSGNSCTSQSFWSQPLPVIHDPGCFAWCSFTKAMISSTEPVPVTSNASRFMPYPKKWQCASIHPG